MPPSAPVLSPETPPSRAPDALKLAHAQPVLNQPSRALHGWAVATLLAMFPLIWFGGLTTSHGAGMSVPDWPNTYGYNMFAVRWDLWLGDSAGGIFFEHTHRLLGSLVGFFALSATLFAWGTGAGPRRRWFSAAAILLGVGAFACFVLLRMDLAGQHRLFGHLVSGFGGLAAVSFVASLAGAREPRKWVRWTTTALLIAICLQGLLGGLRVTAVNLELAIVHGIFAQFTLCLSGFLVLATSRWWEASAAGQRERAAGGSGVGNVGVTRPFVTASIALTLLMIAQLVIAATMRHYQAGLAVPDFPLSYAEFIPPVSADGLVQANERRVFDYELPPTTLGAIWLHTAHRLGAGVITLAVAGLVITMRPLPRENRPARHVWWIAGLLLVQVSLGAATVWMNKPADVATAHVAFGALLLLSAWLLTVRAVRRYGWRPLEAVVPQRQGPTVSRALASSELQPVSA